MSDQELQELVDKAVFIAVGAGTGLISWFRFKTRPTRRKIDIVEPEPQLDHGERIDRLEEDIRELKNSQVDMHRENQDRMREIAAELRDQRKIATAILSKMANLTQ